MENKEILEQSSVKDRLKIFLEYKNISQGEFEKQTSLSNGYVNNIRKSIKVDTFDEKIAPIFPELNKFWLLHNEGEMLNNQKYTEGTEVLILPVSAEGGRLDGFSTQIRAEDCETIISPIKDVDFAMTVTGDSMYPEYPSGSKILVKKINEKAFIDWGRVYVLDTCNGAVIKKIMPGSTEGRIKCLSINEEYPSFEVAFGDIFGMYRVLMCMSLK